MKACNEDCLHCVYEDCILETITAKAYHEVMAINKTLPKTQLTPFQKQRKRMSDSKYRIAHSGEIAIRRRAYRDAHREEAKLYREAHSDEFSAYYRIYHLEHQEAKNAYSHAYYHAHKEAISKQKGSVTFSMG